VLLRQYFDIPWSESRFGGDAERLHTSWTKMQLAIGPVIYCHGLRPSAAFPPELAWDKVMYQRIITATLVKHWLIPRLSFVYVHLRSHIPQLFD
jgi:hypothetical protein